jgi:outer membrane protein OmpA-like peptidoglycan-associated protein
MNSKNFYLVLLLCLTMFTQSYGQSAGALKSAKDKMKNLFYVGAITDYQAILKKYDNAEAKINLAECYRKISDPENAEYWYSQVVRLPEAQPIHNLYYGQMLQRNGKCDQAKEWYSKFTEAVPDDVRGQFLNKACEYEAELKAKGEGIYSVTKTNINSNFDDFGPTLYKDGIVFASNRDEGSSVKRKHCWNGNPFNDLYYVKMKKEGNSMCQSDKMKPEKFSSDINTKFHESDATFVKDEKKMFFTRNNYENGKAGKDEEGIMRLKIYMAEAKGSGWGKDVNLPFNSDQYNTAHPSLNAEGNKLYFSSDMPGGYGGMDIYVSEFENGNWGPPMNLGPQINTEGQEIFPYIHSSGKLFYSSDGLLGLGGLDIFSVNPNGTNQWTAPENAGFPLNSKDDDFGIAVSDNGMYGFLTSDRSSGAGGDDIYCFQKTAAQIEVLVFDALTKEPIEGASVEDTCSGKKLLTNKLGKATFDVPFSTCCNYKADMTTYEPNQMQACTEDANSIKKNLVEIPLSKPLVFALQGIVFDQATGLPLDAAKVTLKSDCGEEEKTFTTDLSGKFKFDLKKECCYTLKGERDNYFAASISGDSLCTKGLKESKVLLANLNLQPSKIDTMRPTGGPIVDNTPKIDPKTGKEIVSKGGKDAKPGKNPKAPKDKVTGSNATTFENSPTQVDKNGSIAYLLDIYYDFDQCRIRSEGKVELEKLRKLMLDNPTYIIEIGAHTDARGTDAYNTDLSGKRAKAVVTWLIKHGIEADRLQSKGYGEEVNVNSCEDNIKCSEKNHQLNRRTEFKVVGCKGCPEDNTKISKPVANPRVDRCNGCPF